MLGIRFPPCPVSLHALIVAYQTQMLLSQADDLGSGQRKVSGQIGGNEVDISSNIAAEAASAKGPTG